MRSFRVLFMKALCTLSAENIPLHAPRNNTTPVHSLPAEQPPSAHNSHNDDDRLPRRSDSTCWSPVNRVNVSGLDGHSRDRQVVTLELLVGQGNITQSLADCVHADEQRVDPDYYTSMGS
eukprot:COSAG02_NODE_1122_length_14450_cov_4.124173_5_plen_120_part_00